MKAFIFFILYVLIYSPSILYSQEWAVRYNGPANGVDEIKSMVVDNSGNTYVTGYSNSGSNGFDYVTIKYNSAGVQQWLRTYNGTGNGSDIPNSVYVDNSGYVYVTGASNRVTGAIFDTDATTIKYDPNGVELWVQRYDGISHKTDGGNDVKTDASGNVYITGYVTLTHGSSYARKDYLTIKYSSEGIQQWTATYNGPANNQDDEAIGLGLDASGNIYVAGTSFAGNDPLGEKDYLTVKYNSSGVQQWTMRYNGPISESDIATDMEVDNAGNSYVTGYSRNSGTDFDFHTIKYNSDGIQQWSARYGGFIGGFDIPFDIEIDNSGNVYVTGDDQSEIYNSDYRTIKYNSAGTLQWSARYNGPANDNDDSYALAIDGNGNVYVTGLSKGVNTDWDIATIKYSPAGVQQWVERYDGPRDSADVGNAIGVDLQGSVYVAGASTGSNTALDFTTLKYSSNPTNIQNIEIHFPSFVLFQNYPNPFNPETQIDFSIPEGNFTSLKIYDQSGRVIATLINELRAAGNYSISFNAAYLSSGIYFYKLTSGNFIETKKMILLK